MLVDALKQGIYKHKLVFVREVSSTQNPAASAAKAWARMVSASVRDFGTRFIEKSTTSPAAAAAAAAAAAVVKPAVITAAVFAMAAKAAGAKMPLTVPYARSVSAIAAVDVATDEAKPAAALAMVATPDATPAVAMSDCKISW